MVFDNIAKAISLFIGMTWDTWWSLVLGFTITGAVETFVSEEQMTELLGGDDWEEIFLGIGLGSASSSCSFAATSTAKSLFKKGASAEASIAGYQFAATDLVAELALVLWVLLGWQFVVAELFGGVLTALLVAYIWKEHVPQRWFDAAREHLMQLEDIQCAACGMSADPEDPDTTTWEDPMTEQEKYFCCHGCLNAYKHMDRNPDEEDTWQQQVTTVEGWKDASRNTMKEWDMLWDDIAIGFVIASLLGAFVPNSWWLTLFGSDAGFIGVTYAATMGVVIGIVTFLCSVGNIPFALILWTNGVPFGAIMSFIYADLLIPPLLKTYKKYYGTRMATMMFLTLGFASVVAGVAVHYVFGGLGMIPPQGQVGGTAPDEYNTVLNLLFTPIFLAQMYVAFGEEEVTSKLGAIPATVLGTGRDLKDAGGIIYDGLTTLYGGVREAALLLKSAGEAFYDGAKLVGRAFDQLWGALQAFGGAITSLISSVADAVDVLRK